MCSMSWEASNTHDILKAYYMAVLLCLTQGLLLLVTEGFALVTGGMQSNLIERVKTKCVNTESNVIMKQYRKQCALPGCSC